MESFCIVCGSPGSEVCWSCSGHFAKQREDAYSKYMDDGEILLTGAGGVCQLKEFNVENRKEHEEHKTLSNIRRLYKKNGDKIQEWNIEVHDSEYRSIEGFVGGAMTTSEWTEATRKNIGRSNEVSSEDQATKEADAKYKLKLDKGYVSDPSGIGAIQFEPMLAHKYTEYSHKIQYPCYVQPKLDGMRCPIRKEGAFSRQGKPVASVPHIIVHLEKLFTENPDIVLDGELYNHDLKDDFNKLISIVKKTKPTTGDLQESALKMQYHVYDMLDTDNPTLGFRERFDRMQELLAEYDISERIVHVVPTFKIDNEEEMEQLYERFLKEGYEGIMIRSNAAYMQKRTVNLLKRKEFIDGEFLIVDIEEGVGNRSKMMGRVIMKTPGGELFEADGSGLGGHEAYMEMLENRENYIGKLATVKYQNLTPDRQVPRFGKVTSIRDYE